MLIGVPKEIKPQENRVGLTPESVKELIDDGNEVIIERTAGQGSGFDDQNYNDVGATVFEKLFTKSCASFNASPFLEILFA